MTGSGQRKASQVCCDVPSHGFGTQTRLSMSFCRHHGSEVTLSPVVQDNLVIDSYSSGTFTCVSGTKQVALLSNSHSRLPPHPTFPLRPPMPSELLSAHRSPKRPAGKETGLPAQMWVVHSVVYSPQTGRAAVAALDD